MTATTNTDLLITFFYLAAVVRRLLVSAWKATAPERNPQ